VDQPTKIIGLDLRNVTRQDHQNSVSGDLKRISESA
jgi:hypothetical protein